MGNCAGYCNGQGENEDNQIRQSFNKQDMIANQHNDFENKYGKSPYSSDPRSLLTSPACGLGDDVREYSKGSRVLGKGTPDMRPSADEQVDEFGRVTKGPYTLKNGATYTG